MVILSDAMKELIKKGQCQVATASQDGWPSIGPKGSVLILDNDTLAFGELVGGQTYSNLLENPKVAISAVDHHQRAGYRFVGKAQLETSGTLYDKFASLFEKMKLPRPVAAVKITIETIYDISVKNPGEKIC